MQDNTSFSQNIDTVFSELQNFVKTESLMGTPLTVEDKTLVPVVSVTLGYGNAGNTKGNENNENNGVGLGARITTNAVVVINKDNVSMLPVNEKGNMTNVIDKLPEMMSTFKQATGNQQQNMMNNNQQNNNQQNNNQ